MRRKKRFVSNLQQKRRVSTVYKSRQRLPTKIGLLIFSIYTPSIEQVHQLDAKRDCIEPGPAAPLTTCGTLVALLAVDGASGRRDDPAACAGPRVEEEAASAASPQEKDEEENDCRAAAVAVAADAAVAKVLG